MKETKKPKSSPCGHSSCAQNFIDTGSTECVEVTGSHTPGPWVTNGFNIFGPSDPKSKHENGRTLVGGVVDDMNDWRARPVDEPINRAEFRAERIANAHLIAAAPELLERLSKASARCADCATCGPALCLECASDSAIIAKARGR